MLWHKFSLPSVPKSGRAWEWLVWTDEDKKNKGRNKKKFSQAWARDKWWLKNRKEQLTDEGMKIIIWEVFVHLWLKSKWNENKLLVLFSFYSMDIRFTFFLFCISVFGSYMNGVPFSPVYSESWLLEPMPFKFVYSLILMK